MSGPTKRVVTGLALIAVFLTAAALAAQSEQTFAQAQRQNAEKLRQYTWKSRTEIQKEGKTKSVQLNLMRYDSRGFLQSTQLSNTAPDMPQRGLRGHIARNRKEDMLVTLEHLKALADSYRDLPPGEMQRLMSSATPVRDGGSQPRLVRASATNVVQRGDAIALWLDAETRTLRKMEVATALEKKTVRVVSEFQDLPNGPNAMVRSVLNYPEDELTLITENFDYTNTLQ
jgi:hypothetical protein